MNKQERIEKVFNPNLPYVKKLYPLYDKFLEDPRECPKCHAKHMYEDGGLAIVCVTCSWRFEIVERVEKIPADVQPLQRAYDSCIVPGCKNTIQADLSKTGVCHSHLCKQRDWEKGARKTPTPFFKQADGSYQINPERIRYGKGKFLHQAYILRKGKVI